MRRLLAVLCVLVLPLAAFGQSVTLPAEIKGAVGAWIIVAPTKIDGGSPRWRIDDGLQEVRLDLLLPPEMLKQLKGKVVTANVPGKYRIECWNAKGEVASEIATCWVTIGTSGPVPPPIPPPPDPPTPAPDEPITKAIFGAYQQEFAADKKDSATKMAQVYEAAAVTAATATAWGDIGATIKSKANELGIGGKLPVVSKTINTKLLAAGFPASPSVLMQPGDADKAKSALGKVSGALRLLP